MKSKSFLLLSALTALTILPACNWWGYGCNCSTSQQDAVQEELVVVVPETEETQPLQDQQVEDLDSIKLPDTEK